MRNIIVLIILFGQLANASVLSQSRMNVELKNSTFKELIDLIEEQTDFGFLYDVEQMREINSINLSVKNESIETILDMALEGTDFTYVLEHDMILVTKRPPQPVQKQETKKLKGTVKDADGNTLPGVSVVVKGTTIGTTTLMDGTYKLKIPKKSKTIVFSFIGMIPQQVQYVGQEVIDIKLLEDTKNIKEIVVTGYQTISKERVAGSFTILNEERLQDQISSNVLTSIALATPGLRLGNNGEIQIRGIGTFMSDQSPLIVIDGFPVESKNSAGNIITDQITELVNPDDIKSITVLKDASASSIYGVRASNGVIVIETKSKSKKNFDVKLSSKLFYRDFSDIRDLNGASTKDVIDFGINRIENGIVQYHGKNNAQGYNNPSLSNLYRDHENGDLSDEDYKVGLDNLAKHDLVKEYNDAFKRAAVTQMHSLNFSGSNKKIDYYLSLTYDKNKGSNIGQESERVALQSRTKFKLADNLNISLNIYHSEKKHEAFKLPNLNSYDVWESYYDEDGTPKDVRSTYSPNRVNFMLSQGLLDPTNVALLDYKNEKYESENKHTRFQTSLNYNISPNIRFSSKLQYEGGSQFNTNYANENSYKFRRSYNTYTVATPEFIEGNLEYSLINYLPFGGIYDETRSEYKNYNIQNLLSYDYVIGDKHKITGLFGHELKQLKNKYTRYETRYGYNPELLTYAQVPEERVQYNGAKEDFRLAPKANFSDKTNRYFSLFSNFAYEYDKKYILTGNIRLDQTNLFGQDDKYKYRPIWSAATAWNITNEDFFNVDAISYLRLKASFGYTGNVNRNHSPYLKMRANSDSQGNISATILSPSNDKLRWEKTEMTNIGLESRFFNNKLGFNIEFYSKKGTDLLANIPLDPTYGFPYATINASSMNNTGFDATMFGIITNKNDLKIQTYLNLSHNKNKITKYYDKAPRASSLVYKSAHLENTAYDAIYVYKWAGLDETGFPTYYNEEGEVTKGLLSNFENSSRTVKKLGTYNPTVYGSFNPIIKYKNLKLSAVVSYKFGHYFKTPGFTEGTRGFVHGDLTKVWKETGDELITDIPRLRTSITDPTSDMYQYSSNLFEKADNITLSNVNFSYTVHDLSVFKKIKFEIQANNLGLLWAANKDGIDPNLYTNYKRGSLQARAPRKTTYVASIKLNF